MIRYRLICANEHEFESWFPSSAAYDDQAARGLVSCPVCESQSVEKALMTPSLGHSAKRGKAASSPGSEPVVPMISEPERHMRQMLRAFREHVTRDSDHVGRNFASEARAIHYGEKPQRSIHGETSASEARALIEEGIEVAPLPPAPDDWN